MIKIVGLLVDRCGSLCMAFLVLAVVASAVCCFAAPPAGSNVRIDDLSVDVTIAAKNGKAVRVKEVSNYTLSAAHADEMAVLFEFYDNEAITIDKASGQGGKPVYKAAETGSVFYSGNRVCSVPVQLKAGKQGKASFERTYVKPEFFTGVMPLEQYDIGRYSFTLHIPKGLAMQVKISEHNMPSNVKGKFIERADETVYTLVLENIPALPERALTHAPAIERWHPYVAINACFGSVDELYAHLSGLLEPEDDINPAVAEITDKVTAGLGDDIAKVNAIGAWVQRNIRYVAIEHGEWGHRPERAEKVLEKRYGDCKGSANLIRAMLRAAGIDGRRVWIGTRNSSLLPWSESCSIHSGNHMIAAAVLPDTTIYIDGTVKYAPAGYLPYSDAGQEVIIENGKTCTVAKIPSAKSERNVLAYNAKLSIDNTALDGTATIAYYGSFHIMAQSLINEVTASRRESVLAKLVCFDRKAMTASDVSCSGDEATAEATTLQAHISEGNCVKAVEGGAKLYVSPRPLRYFSYEPFPYKSRISPFYFGTPANYRAEISIALPEGYVAAALPKRVAISSEWFDGFVEYTCGESGTVLCRAELRTLSTEGLGSQIEEWNNAVRQVTKASNTPLVLVRNQ